MKLAYLGFGEAASSIAAGLLGEGMLGAKAYDVLLLNDEKKDAVLKKMADSKVEACFTPRECVSDADIIISAVPSQFAVATCKSAVDYVKKGAIYLDVSTAGPKEKLEMESLLSPKGASVVDGAMLGPLLKYKHKVPMLLSGEKAEEVKAMLDPYHMSLDVYSRKPGDATSIKFVRSIVAKGLACLLFESIQAAQHFGVEDTVVDSFLESYGAQFESIIDGYVSGTCIHAKRREHEMENVLDMLKAAGLPCEMTEATMHKLANIAELDIPSKFANGVPRNWKGTIAGWGLNDK